jgi:hypothetical protein
LTDSEIVFTHVHSNPEAFLDALNDSPPKTKQAVLGYMKTLPKIGSDAIHAVIRHEDREGK